MANGFFNKTRSILDASNRFPQIPRNPETETAYHDYVLRLLEHVAKRDDESYKTLRKSAALYDSLTKKNLVDFLDKNVIELISGNESSWKFFVGKAKRMPSRFYRQRGDILDQLVQRGYPVM